MQEAIRKADVLIEALHWIRQFRGRVTVIKLGGSLLDDSQALDHLLLDVVFMETVGMHPVLVHGAGAAISRAMQQAGLTPRFVQGRRYTDPATLEIVENVLAYQTNEQLAHRIEQLGGKAQALNFRTTNVLFGQRLQLAGEDGQPVDLGLVGTVTQVDRATLETLCHQGIVPVIPSMCLDQDGQKLNVNADTAAMAVAKALQAEKLVFVSDVNGVRRDKNDPSSVISTLTQEEARQLIRSGVIDAGMVPKVEACLEILQHGVRKVHIIDGRIRHALLLEIYTTEGIGTQIVQNP
ncbi:MAG: acetylglutamate kinase [Thermoguttaceae bacterium]|nr:acetylglutamate kinase [Thermoguttaceae bacterium]MDW8039563.1 acetylglutamate kinase [Thermoguttaceae bacterium]